MSEGKPDLAVSWHEKGMNIVIEQGVTTDKLLLLAAHLTRHAGKMLDAQDTIARSQQREVASIAQELQRGN
jgi:hypothetical protein